MNISEERFLEILNDDETGGVLLCAGGDDFFSALGNKNDRPAKGGWAPGNYSNKCGSCGIMFSGAKRASSCSDCAYK